MRAPTVIEHPEFNAQEDCETIKQNLKSDRGAVLKVLCLRSYEQRKKIEELYKASHRKSEDDEDEDDDEQDLQSALKSAFKGDAEDLVLALFYSNVDYDAYVLKQATKGFGTNETALVDVLCTRSNQEINEIKETYRKLYKKDLEKDLKGDLKGDHEKLMLEICDAHRTNEDVDEEKAQTDADAFNKAAAGFGTDEGMFIHLMTSRSYRQLRYTFSVYKDKTGKDFLDMLDSEFSGDLYKVLLATAKVALHGRQHVLAERLHDAMKGVGTKEDQLIRIIVSRSLQDLEQVRRYYLKIYNKNLEDDIESETSGDFRNALLLLIKGNNPENLEK